MDKKNQGSSDLAVFRMGGFIIIVCLILLGAQYATKSFMDARTAKNAEKKTVAIKNPVPRHPRLGFEDIPKEQPWGNNPELVLDTSVGESAFLGDFVHVQRSFSREGDEQIVQINQEASGKTFKNGDEITIAGSIFNPEEYPFTDVQLYGNLYRLEPDANEAKVHGHNLIKEFVIFKHEGLAGKEEKKFSYKLQIPQDAVKGDYVVSTALMQGRRSPIRGLPYFWDNINEWYNPLGNISFKVDSNHDKSVWIDKSTIWFRKDGYENKFFRFRKFTRVAYKDMDLSFDVVNDTDEDKELLISYDLMRPRVDYLAKGGWFSKYFDGNWQNEIDKETVTIKAHERKTIQHPLDFRYNDQDELFGSLYTLSIIVEPKGTDMTTMSNIPIILESDGMVAGEIIWPGITKFPIKKGEKFTAWVGFVAYLEELTNTFEARNRGRVEMRLYDRQGEEIGNTIFDGYLTNMQRAWKKDIVAEKDLDYIKLDSAIYTDKGLMVDKFERIYDCNLLGENICPRAKTESMITQVLRILIPSLIIILLSGYALLALKRVFISRRP